MKGVLGLVLIGGGLALGVSLFTGNLNWPSLWPNATGAASQPPTSEPGKHPGGTGEPGTQPNGRTTGGKPL